LPELRTTWEKITNVAIAGLARQELPVIEGDDAIAQLCAGIMATGEKPAQLLSIAGALQLYQTVGARPPHDSTPAPAPAAVETKSYCSFQIMRLLEIALTNSDIYQILPELASLIQKNDMVVMPNMLPMILTAMVKSPERLETLLPIIGEHGIWLARQNPAWQKILLSVSEEFCREKWETGTRAERTAALKYLRGIDPASARALLEEVMKAEAPETLNEFIGALTINLSLDDEPLLESLLDSKRKAVRKTVSTILDCIPGTAYQQRMIERLNQFIKITPAQPATLFPPRMKQDVKIEVITPAEFDKTWSRDAIEFDNNYPDLSYCVREMITAVPLSYWEDRGQCGPAELIKCANSESLIRIILRTWLTAVRKQKNVVWMEEIIRHGDYEEVYKFLQFIVAAFTYKERDEMFISLLKDPPEQSYQLLCALRGHNEVWSLELSVEVVNFNEKLTSKDEHLKTKEGNISNLMTNYIQPCYLGYVRSDFAKIRSNFSETICNMRVAILDFREEMYRAFEEKI